MLKIRVIAPYIMLKVKDPATGGVAVREFYKGAILPDGADSDDVKRLTGKNMLAEEQLADPEPEQAPEPTLVETPVPPVNANKAEWVAYAVSRRAEDVSEEAAKAEAEAMKKDDLIALYGNGS